MPRTLHRFVFALVAWFAGAALLHAADIETRTFAISTGDAKPAGDLQLQVEVKDDGTYVANVRMFRQKTLLAGVWRFGYHGIESWKDDRLQRLDAALDEDGNKRRVAATPLARIIH